MRILQVRFKNLNSLVGEWEIDFTVPAFTSNGIFAITGPTGAGKTTILDAICLALYGRTPRLNKISKSGNEIMFRQTGDCFAEVTFETQRGKFRCHWAQHRAGRKPNGQLQAPRHEIADVQAGKVLETRIREVAARIEEVTGMDFDRFTRSMLLAQGGFAAFLQAEPDERAPILEQITGTEIYSRISIRVHERRREESEKLRVLQAELEGLQILDEAEEWRLNTLLTEKKELEEDLSRQIEKLQRAIEWLDDISKLEQELEQIGQQKKNWQQRNRDFEAQRQKLERARQALQLEGEYSGLTSLREEQEKDQHVLEDQRTKLPQLEAEVEEARLRHRQAEEKWQESKQALNTVLPVIRKVQELDVKIGERDNRIDQLRQGLAAQEKTLEDLVTKQTQASETLEDERKSLQELLELLDASKADEALVEQLTGLKERFDVLRDRQSLLTAKREEMGQIKSELSRAIEALEDKTRALENHRKAHEQIQNALTELQNKLNDLLEGQDLNAWVRLSAELAERKSQFEKGRQAVESLIASQKALDDKEKHRRTLLSKKSELEKCLESRIEQRNALQWEFDLLQEKISLLDRIQSFEEARRHLRDGEPCPLCGATDHPYARGNVLVPDDTRKRLEQVKADLTRVDEEVTELKVQLGKLDKDLEQNVVDLQTHRQSIERFEKELQEIKY